MASARKIAIIAGDGIGPEVIAPCVRLLEWFRDVCGVPLELLPLDLGADRYLRTGEAFPEALEQEVRAECEAVLLGAIGDPRIPDAAHARAIVLGMRQRFDLYANIRPVRALADRLVPLKGRCARDVDFVVVRENSEGAYVGFGGQLRRGAREEIAVDEDVSTRFGVERLVRTAFELARAQGRDRVHLAEKSNALRNGQELWHRVFFEVASEYSDIRAHAEYVDALCYRMISDPAQYRVIVSNNLFGDIISDLAAALQGGLGMAPSANVHPAAERRVALFEPVHGSAPELAGRNLANPFGAFLSTALLLGHLGYDRERLLVEGAVQRATGEVRCTPDIGGELGTREAADVVLSYVAQSRA